MWPSNYELVDNAASTYAANASIYSQQLYSSSAKNSSTSSQLNNQLTNQLTNQLSNQVNNTTTTTSSGNQFNSASNYQSSSGNQFNPPKSQLPTRINNSFWSNYTSYSNYNQLAAAVQAIANNTTGDTLGSSSNLQSYSPSNLNLINNSNHDSLKTRPNSLETSSSTNFYNSTGLSFDQASSSTPGKLFPNK